eukprot:929031-Pelagomonas_calceolata.AAC.3
MNVLAPYIAHLFAATMEQAEIQLAWKVAKITPLYKKGSVLDPRDYRMLALSGTLFRLYANVLREVITGWCQQKLDPRLPILVDGCKQVCVPPHLRVKQGCPLSPLLFSSLMYKNCSAENVQGAITGSGEVQVKHMLYIGDLCFTGNQPQQLQLTLDRLHVYARWKGLVINVAEFEIVHFGLCRFF